MYPRERHSEKKTLLYANYINVRKADSLHPNKNILENNIRHNCENLLHGE